MRAQQFTIIFFFFAICLTIIEVHAAISGYSESFIEQSREDVQLHWTQWSSNFTICQNEKRSRVRKALLRKKTTCPACFQMVTETQTEGCQLVTSTVENIALRKSAYASSISDIMPSGRAVLAVDGDTNGKYYYGSCMRTDRDMKPWLRIDLGEMRTIREVIVYNRADCCASRANGLTVHIENEMGEAIADCGSHRNMDVKTARFVCSEAPQGRYVYLFLNTSQYLHLCEVEVLGDSTLLEECPATHPYMYSKGTMCCAHPKEKTDTSSGTECDGSLLSHDSTCCLNDEYISCPYGNCTERKGITDHIWCDFSRGYIDGGQKLVLENQAPHTCTRACMEKKKTQPAINGVTVSNGIGEERVCWCHVNGSYSVPSKKYRQCFLRPTEPIVFGWSTWSSAFSRCNNSNRTRTREHYIRLNSCESCYYKKTEKHMEECNQIKTNVTNVALNKPVTSSSIYQQYPFGRPSLAVDGNTNGHLYYGSCMCTAFDKDPWMRIDLKESHFIHEVIVHNRVDCCSERANGLSVEIESTPGVTNSTCGQKMDMDRKIAGFDCPVSAVGRYVYLSLTGDQFLHLCEVEVFGVAVSAITPAPTMPSTTTSSPTTTASAVTAMQSTSTVGPVGVPASMSTPHFVGWASFVPDGTMYEDEPNLDKNLIDACARDFTGSRPATTDLILSNIITDLPNNVPTAHVIAPACTGNRPGTNCASGDYRWGLPESADLTNITVSSLRKMHLHRAYPGSGYALCVSDSPYKFADDKLAWEEAEIECQKWSGHLATISSISQNNYLSEELKKRNIAKAWIGLNDRQEEGLFKWSSDLQQQVTFKQWTTGQPNGGVLDNCVELLATDDIHYGRWADLPCEEKLPFVCQKKNLLGSLL